MEICLCICISTHCSKSFLGMYLYLDILMNVMSKKSVKVIPGSDVSNFLELLGQGKHLPFLLNRFSLWA